jgi:ribosome-associated toxin RatA of RatAB toxin-antitoxin module
VLRGEKSIEVPVPASEAYARVADVEGYPAWQTFIAEAEVEERDAAGRPLVVASRLDAKVKVLSARLRYTYAEPTQVSWTLDHGDMKGLDGSFTVEPVGDTRSRITLVVAVDPGMRLGLLLRGPVEDKVRARVVDGTLDELAATFG